MANLDEGLPITRKKQREGELKAEARRTAENEFERRKWANPVEFLEVITGQIELELTTIIDSVLDENIVPEIIDEDPLALTQEQGEQEQPEQLQLPEPAQVLCVDCHNPRGDVNHGIFHGVTFHLGLCSVCIQLYTIGRPCYVCQEIVERKIQG